MQKFHDVTVEIEAALTQIPYDKFEVSEEVREQVLLLKAFKFFCFFSFGLKTIVFANSNDTDSFEFYRSSFCIFNSREQQKDKRTMICS